MLQQKKTRMYVQTHVYNFANLSTFDQVVLPLFVLSTPLEGIAFLKKSNLHKKPPSFKCILYNAMESSIPNKKSNVNGASAEESVKK